MSGKVGLAIFWRTWSDFDGHVSAGAPLEVEFLAKDEELIKA